jgi:hypothetical protein
MLTYPNSFGILSDMSNNTDSPIWKTGEPPHDREVVLIGKIMEHDAFSTGAQMFCCRAMWHNEAWCHAEADEYGTRMAIRRHAEDETLIHFWADLPAGDSWPVHIAEKPIAEPSYSVHQATCPYEHGRACTCE